MNKLIIQSESIVNRIRFVRNQKVILDEDLAELYGVTTFNLNKAVKRNKKRFPKDFMFQLNQKEFSGLIFQFGISSSWGGRRKLPYAFTEQGVAMLSGILNSDTAIKVNITIMRIFVQINRVLQSNIKITQKLFEIEKRMDSMETKQNRELSEIYLTLKNLIIQEEKPKHKIGFKLPRVK